MNEITGKTLIEWGFKPGSWFGAAISEANLLREKGFSEAEIRLAIEDQQPPAPLPLQPTFEYYINLPEGTTPDEYKNNAAVLATMDELVRTPTVERAAVMPDACPAGPVGTIPVGGIVATRNALHPGMASADVCCSVALSNLGGVDPAEVLRRAGERTHFGGGGRRKGDQFIVAPSLLSEFGHNPFLHDLQDVAIEHMGTQGDGNHFLFVGTLTSTGETCVVTHHGSRKPGAMLYKRAMRVAEKYRQKLSPDTLKQNAWIPADSDDGVDYWNALQIIRAWTKMNHLNIHHSLEFPIKDQFWNEHNFIFHRDGLYYHGKGATPGWNGYANDATGLTLIPLNMAEPVLITRGNDAEHGLGFLPHGAGRNYSRSQHRRNNSERSEQEILEEETKGLAVRFFSGYPDITELPSAYKNATSVINDIARYGLAEIVDSVQPYGCIMAGEWTKAFKK